MNKKSEAQADVRDLPEHVPVLFDEVMSWLQPTSGGRYIDATVGLGGHSEGILERSAPDGQLLALDIDEQALAYARERLSSFGERVTFVCGQYADLEYIAQNHGFEGVDGILFDLGVSSLQLDDPTRGFSFQRDGPLDMRMGSCVDLTAEEIVNTWPEEEVARVIYEFGEERHSRRIARAICAERPFHSTRELADLVAHVVGRRGRIHPATRTFQALRIAVNEELASLKAALPQAVDLLRPGGRLAVIAFHSLEDRIVKRFFVRESKDCICPPRLPQCVCDHEATIKRLTRGVVWPSEEEVAVNPRSRSGRLRVVERLP
ncbi:MAG: 16S rRNA (cytosine(1402)-N(4))-methyltransferase RsmH [Chloroflexota bacterium]|nr:16S rRNA (cytosine(1402)-N(4))-methyltransferase RsmH [Chloroflexota bacterium]